MSVFVIHIYTASLTSTMIFCLLIDPLTVFLIFFYINWTFLCPSFSNRVPQCAQYDKTVFLPTFLVFLFVFTFSLTCNIQILMLYFSTGNYNFFPHQKMVFWMAWNKIICFNNNFRSLLHSNRCKSRAGSDRYVIPIMSVP